MFDPRVLFLVIWSTQIVGFSLAGTDFYPIAIETWLAFFLGISGFYGGALLTLRKKSAQRSPRVKFSVENTVIQRFFRLAMCLYFLACVVAIRQITNILGADVLSAGDFPMIRQAVIVDFLGDRELFSSIRVFYFGVGLCVFLLSYGIFLTRFQRSILFGVGLLSAVATTGRLYLLLYIVSSSYLLYRQKLVSKKFVAMSFAGFISIFFLVALLFDKGGNESGSVVEQLVWNVQVYFMSSLACFNNYVVSGAQETYGGILIPNVLRPAIEFLGISMAEKPNLLPFAMVPMQCNTYTALFPLFHDLGYIGVFFGFVAIGFAHSFLWIKQQRSSAPIILFAYALSLYPLAMSMFEDAYFSSPGFWLMLWIPPLALHLYRLVLTKPGPRRSQAVNGLPSQHTT